MENKTKSIIKGRINRKVYWARRMWVDEPTLSATREFIKNETLIEVYLDKPSLKIGEKIYIEELDITVTVEDTVRSTSGAIVYFTEHEMELIEDEVTGESFAEQTIIYEQMLKEYKEHNEEQEEKERLMKLKEEQSNTHWFKKLIKKGF